MVTLNEVIRRAESKDDKKPFIIRDLFTDQEWKNAKDVKAIGRAFRDEVRQKRVKGVRHKCRKLNNHNEYVKE